MLEKQPDSTYREEMRMLLGNARFMQGKYDEAKKDYRKYVEDYPKGNSSKRSPIAWRSLSSSAARSTML
jgi:TolA-binding protein